MPRDIDALCFPTLKHVRDRWWDDRFRTFLEESLQPRPGKRLLDVGCGTGLGAVYLGFHVAQVRLVGVDIVEARAHEAHDAARDHQVCAAFAAATATALPFDEASFDSVYCVAVLQHVDDVPLALAEFARVVKPGGRVLCVEPDNAARYWFSSCESGGLAYQASLRFFDALRVDLGDCTEPAIGPQVPTYCRTAGLEPLAVRAFPVSNTRLGAPAAPFWDARRVVLTAAVARAQRPETRVLGEALLEALERYRHDAHRSGAAFVELQHTILFATLAQRGSA